MSELVSGKRYRVSLVLEGTVDEYGEFVNSSEKKAGFYSIAGRVHAYGPAATVEEIEAPLQAPLKVGAFYRDAYGVILERLADKNLPWRTIVPGFSEYLSGEMSPDGFAARPLTEVEWVDKHE